MLNFFKPAIRIVFIDEDTGQQLGYSKMKRDQLPASFTRPAILDIAGKKWQLVKADPVRAEEVVSSKKLTLRLRGIDQQETGRSLFSVPTIANILPVLVDYATLEDFTLDLHEDEWRQIEFLPARQLPAIQKEMAYIEAILAPGDEMANLQGYASCHRRMIPVGNLSIPFNDFFTRLEQPERGTVRFCYPGHIGFVENGFAIRSTNHTYYGTLKDGIIQDLCLHDFDGITEELSQLFRHYSLLLAGWCTGAITTL